MIRGTFANVRLRNQLAPGTEGGFTRDFSRAEGPVTTIYEASVNYLAAGTPLVILAGGNTGRDPRGTGPPKALRCWECEPCWRCPTNASTGPT